MLRKLSHIALAITLLVSSSGVTLSMHYCMGRLMSAAINEAPNVCCDGLSGCCETDNLQIEIKDEYVANPGIEMNHPDFSEVLMPVLFVYIIAWDSNNLQNNHTCQDLAPPPLVLQKRLAFLQTYRC